MNIKFQKGISEKQIGQLIEYSSTDELVGKFTHDRERFGSREAFGEWLKKGRDIKVMTNDKGDLLGIFWYGFKEMPLGDKNYDTTFAIRIYGEARGKGLGLDFMKKSLKERGIWLKISDDNLAAKALYFKFGFRQVSEPDENNKIIMVF